jgi:hypothetical protein
VEAGQSFSTHDRLAASALRFLIDWKQHIAFALVITFRMKWARSSNLRRMISLDRNPGFAERNRLSAKASRLRRRAIGFARRAAAAPPRGCSLRCRSKFGPAGSSASTAPGSARVPRGESAIGLCSRRSGVAWRWPCFNRVWPTRSCVTGFRDLATCAAGADHDTITTLDSCLE